MSKAYDRVYEAAVELSREERIALVSDVLATVVHDNYPVGPKVTREEILRAAEEAHSGKPGAGDPFEMLNELDREFASEEAKPS